MALAEYDLSGKVAFVTGAGRGIGKGIAQVLAEAGADVVVNSLTDRHVTPMAREIARATGRRGCEPHALLRRHDRARRLHPRARAGVGAPRRAGQLHRPRPVPDPVTIGEKAYAERQVNAQKTVPLRREGHLREVGLLALYLAAPASDYMTGQTLYLDGGMTL